MIQKVLGLISFFKKVKELRLINLTPSNNSLLHQNTSSSAFATVQRNFGSHFLSEVKNHYLHFV